LVNRHHVWRNLLSPPVTTFRVNYISEDYILDSDVVTLNVKYLCYMLLPATNCFPIIKNTKIISIYLLPSEVETKLNPLNTAF
jgi:hypothetical protein